MIQIVSIIVVIVATISYIMIVNFKATKIHKMSFKESIDLTELPIITFEVGKNKKFNFLLDTGSNDSIVDRTALETKGVSYIDAGMEGNLVGLDSTESKKVSFVKIDLFYKERTYSNNFLVTDLSTVINSIKESSGVVMHGLLGSNFFNKYKYVIDFDKLIAYSKIK